MLFSTFESWYVYEHSERHGFPSEWIGITFSISTFWNGMIAILAGTALSPWQHQDTSSVHGSSLSS